VSTASPLPGGRTHMCGGLRAEHEGDQVVLAGWVATVRNHGGILFLDLRDREGVVQVVAHPQDAPEAFAASEHVSAESVVEVRGAVRLRPAGTRNEHLSTGDVEIAASTIAVLSGSRTPPFPIEDRVQTEEALRLRYRYLDLRRPEMTGVFLERARIANAIRRFFDAHGFVDVETPMLTKSTPEGARDFLVPSRLQRGKVYALPQSPQQFKQLLMVAGFDRYYQLAHCFRDEDLRADRHWEFTQLDMELSFATEEDVYDVLEELFGTLWRDIAGVEIPRSWPRLTYEESMRR